MFDWRDNLRDSAGNLPPDLPASGPDHPNVPVDHREDRGFFSSVGHGAKESVQDLAKAGSWVLDKVGIHWYDDAISRINLDQLVAAEEKWNPFGEFAGSVLAILPTTGINPVTGIPSLAGRLIPSAAKVAARTAVAEKLLDIAAKSEQSAKNVYNSLKVAGVVKPIALNTASLVPFTLGASLNIDNNGVATVNNKKFWEHLGRDLATVTVLHGLGKLIGFAITKNSPLDIAQKELSRDTIEEANPEVSEQGSSRVVTDAPEDNLDLKERKEENTEEHQPLSDAMKDSLMTQVENPPESGVTAFDIQHTEKSAHLIGEATAGGSVTDKVVSTLYRDFKSAIISRFGIKIGGVVRSIQDPETISRVKRMDSAFKAFRKQRGARKVFYTENFNKRLEELHKTNPKLHEEVVNLAKKYSYPLGMNNIGAQEARAKFAIDYNSGALHVNHPVYWLERNGKDLEYADVERLNELREAGEKSANWLQAIINESDRSDSLEGTRLILRDTIRAIENYKTPEEQEAIFEAQKSGFTGSSEQLNDMRLDNLAKEYSEHVSKTQDPTSKFYTKLMTVLTDDSKKDAFFKYVECLVGA